MPHELFCSTTPTRFSHRPRPLAPVAGLLALLTGAAPVVAHAQPGAATVASPSPMASAAAQPGAADSARQEAARAAFERGYALMQQGALDAALADFERSRALFATKGNTRNAAVCLDRLGRPDEALERLEQLQRDFPTIGAEDRDSIAREIARLRGLLGVLDVRSDEAGATVVVDGRVRGTTPLAAPIRVNAGTHAVRLVLAGHAPFEDRAIVARGQMVALDARLPRLLRSGRVLVRSASDVAATVLVDGVSVGPSPWEGALPPGRHAVALVGAPPLGSEPATVEAREDQPATITLELTPLRGVLRIEPTPRTAAVALDGVTLGLGTWDGRVRPGPHEVEATSEGFLPDRRRVSVPEDGNLRVELALARDPLSPMWGRKARPRFALELSGAFAGAATGLGGDLSACSACSASPGVGGRVLLGGAYVAPSGLRLGVEVGGMLLSRHLDGRAAELAVGPAKAPITAPTDDRLRLQGVVAGLFAGFAREGWPVELRLGAGVLLGSVDDARATRVDSAGTLSLRQTPAARYVRLAPELRLRHTFADHVTLHVGVAVSGLLAITAPRWSPVDGQVTVKSVGSVAVFGDERLTDGFVLSIEPGAGAAYTF